MIIVIDLLSDMDESCDGVWLRPKPRWREGMNH